MQKNNQFTIEINGIDVLLVQEVTMPEIETNVLSYGTSAGIPDIKIAGKKKVGEMVLKKLRPSIGFDKAAMLWFESTNVSSPLAYKKNIVVRETNELGLTVSQYICEGCFPSKVTHSGFKRGDASELVMEDVTMSMDNFYQV